VGNIETITKISSALASAVPKIIALIQQGRDVKDIKLSEVISTDALEEIRSANSRAKNFIQG
jgi:hypothetical protein